MVLSTIDGMFKKFHHLDLYRSGALCYFEKSTELDYRPHQIGQLSDQLTITMYMATTFWYLDDLARARRTWKRPWA